jgi:hypothetical protein
MRGRMLRAEVDGVVADRLVARGRLVAGRADEEVELLRL